MCPGNLLLRETHGLLRMKILKPAKDVKPTKAYRSTILNCFSFCRRMNIAEHTGSSGTLLDLQWAILAKPPLPRTPLLPLKYFWIQRL